MQQAQGVQGTIYLLHFDKPLKHARHYIGWTGNLDERLMDHAEGRGSALMAAVSGAGIAFSVAKTWKGDRHFERRLKNRKCTPKFCPVCNGNTPEVIPA